MKISEPYETCTSRRRVINGKLFEVSKIEDANAVYFEAMVWENTMDEDGTVTNGYWKLLHCWDDESYG